MMIRRGDDRGTTELGWLHSRHTFSFGEYRDRAHMGFHALRVINDDIVEPGQGFGTHAHHDMEIISIVLEGALEHRDSLGHGAVLRPGEVQVMSAGSGIQHSEFNPSPTDRVRFLQVWLFPAQRDLEPSYGQARFVVADMPNRWVRVAGPRRDAPDGALPIHQDCDVRMARIEPGAAAPYALAAGRAAWVHVISGACQIGPEALRGGDAAAFEQGREIAIHGGAVAADVLLFDLAGT